MRGTGSIGGTGSPRSEVFEDCYRDRLAFDSVTRGSHCVDCYPGACPYNVYVRDGRIVREEIVGAFLEDETESGAPDIYPLGCNKGAAWSQQIDSPDRLRHPLRRVGPRGSGQWEEISWDEALDAVADALIDTVEAHGPEAIFHEGTPEVGAVMATDRFLGLFGGLITDLNGSINDFAPGHHLTFGKFYPITSGGDFLRADVLIFWHLNPAYTIIPFFHYCTEARYAGTELVLFSPDVSPSHGHVDYHVPVKWGTDAAVALAMCQVIVDEGLVDEDFVRTQTDLSLLVRSDSERFLRQSDLVEDGRDDRFYHLDPASGIVEADRTNLLCDYRPALSGMATARLTDGSEVTVRPLMARLKEHLQAYTPERVQEIAGTHPETLRTLARKIAGGRTRIVMGMGANKAYHSDLYQRTMNLLLALSGNWGRPGAGTNCWAATQIDGQIITNAKAQVGPEGAEAVLAALETVEDAIRQREPTATDELVSIELWREFGRNFAMVPPVFLWYWHCGFADRWNNKDWNDPAMARSFDDYFDEAMREGWWDSVARPRPENPPRMMIECGGNILRRTRGGRQMLLENLWPKLDSIVTIDFRMSTTALHSDIVLPAAQHYEKVSFHIPIMSMIVSDQAAPPIGEAKPEWEIFAELCRALERRAAARGLDTFTHRDGSRRRYDELWGRFTLDGDLLTQERVADEVIRDSAYAGVLAEGTDLTKLRETGHARFTAWGRMAMAQGQASPWPEGEPFTAFRNHIELGHPYPTLTRRAQFLIEHPWFVEAGEDLPVHKDPPTMGGDYPYRMTTGHNRWSIHEMNMANRRLLQTHRGEPHAVLNPADAAAEGIEDGARVRVFNDAGAFIVRSKLSPAQRPGGVTVYNGWAPFMFEGWAGPNEVEPGMVKYLGLAGGYGHLRYGPLEWQPVPTDRCVSVGLQPLGA